MTAAVSKRLPRRVLLASANRGKLREIAAILDGVGIEVLAQSEFHLDEAAETGLTFVENAIIKARWAAARTGLPAIADDSGLEVEALGGAPGIYSARYAGPEASDQANVDKLLRVAAPIPDDRRQARFHCTMVYLRQAADPSPLIAEGVWEGRLLRAPQGRNGFGYDPVFYLPEHGCSAADLDPETKNRLSHRGHALRQLYTLLCARHDLS
ncbi:MAG: RdgB/HAM1 family non-canonical purine NTP pyrophosphatase [Gammaproteobacteria bacterium]